MALIYGIINLYVLISHSGLGFPKAS